ncbi:type I polyketide synthase [Variovorax sp. J22R115]|uniref:type I polyketide synthase n=1 Tax=Variovorax sp. J22R115 TaxID=3053509 RepID=UPI002576192D|nr:type I polyketide synthase [Variovorax sp. J22R115]MDM0053046.1 SDR family NAD(P)-dependent oxidoreductase [Variovorax sp. J22R115]
MERFQEFASIASILQRRASRGDQLAYAFLHDSEVVDTLSYRALDEKARNIAAHLRANRATGPVLLCFPSGLEFIAAFFGCLYAGLIALPLYPPSRKRMEPRIAAIMADAQPGFGLTHSALLAQIREFSALHTAGTALQWMATDVLADDAAVRAIELAPADSSMAYLQYTSGSTSMPKGVIVSHLGLLQTLSDLDRGWRHEADSVMVTWLPQFHDMGLIYGLLQPLYGGFPCYLMDPMAFLQRPVRWLEAISRYGGTHSAGPNFAFDLCVQAIGEAEKAHLDLRRWSVALNAAEPVRASTLHDFAAAFAPCGFAAHAFCPGYGLAEGTLKVTAVRRGVGPTLLAVRASALAHGRAEVADDKEPDVRMLVGCGVSEIGARVVIVDPETALECEAAGIGEIWVHSDSVAQGYWRRAKESEQTFAARLGASGEGPFLRTGDLGFVRDGELFVTGRLKDLIIIRGVNHYPQDIELSVEHCHSALRPGAGVAFATEVDGEEKLVIAQELERTRLRHIDVDEVVESIRTAVAREHDLALHAIVLLRPASIPKTSSGKLQRRACRSEFEAGKLSIVAQWRESQPPSSAPAPASSGADDARPGSIRNWIVAWMAARLGVAPVRLDVQAPFATLGLDSLAAVQLSGDLGRWLARSLSPTIVFDHPTPEALARHLERPASLPASAPRLSVLGDVSGTEAEPIAVIGIGCRFPAAPDVDAFWQALIAGVDSAAPVPSQRWAAARAPLPPGHFLDAVDRFDADFFGISPREAESMDPQQRLLLEVACEAIEDAGLGDLAGSPTGVFVGISTSDYARLLLSHGHPDAYAGTGGALSITANRLSYLLDLRGPSWAVDTACSSSLVAVHQASQALRLRECDVALAGGVNVMSLPELTLALGEARMLSPDGRCKTFDASADGYGRGEGCGVIVLKRYRDALRDGDTVAALLLGSAVNQDGRSNGLTAPNGLAQQQVIRNALAIAGVAPAEIGYVEAHGTGTPLGDPIEVAALTAVLSEGRTADLPCWLGSVKTAIGHLEAAAGIAGLVKTVLALQHAELPAHLHLQRPNPHLKLDGTPFSIPTTRHPWPRGARRRIAGVSSFGFGGTNAHVIVAEAPAQQPVLAGAEPDRPQHLLALSAKSVDALRDQARRLDAHLGRPGAPDLADLCHTANARRVHHRFRVALVSDRIDDLRRQLAEFAADPDGSASRHGPGDAERRLAMLFTGQGSQYREMGHELYRSEPTFRRFVNDCDAMLGAQLSPSLRDAWFGAVDEGRLDETAYTQPALFVLELGLAQLWRSWGVEPAALLGHSVGEYAAAAFAGVFAWEDALRLVAARGRLMQALPRDGLMAVIAADHTRVLAVLGTDHPQVSVAAVNGPRNTVISGARTAVQALVERFTRAGIGTTLLRTSHAFHSPLVEPMLAEFADLVAGVPLALPRIPLISNLTGEAAGAEIATPQYWCRHVREPVLFSAGVTALARRGCRTFLEVGPAPVLLGMARQSVADDGLAWLPSLRPGVSDARQMLDSLASWYVRGAAVDWRGFDRDRVRRRVRLPTYAFQRQRYWLADAQAPSAPATADDIYRVEWPPAPPLDLDAGEAAASREPGCWLLLADRGGVGLALAEALEALGHRCLRIGRDAGPGALDAHTLGSRLDAFMADAGLPLRGAVHLWSAEAVDQAEAEAETDCGAALALVRALTGQPSFETARLWLVTRSAVPAADSPQPLGLAGAALWGLGRSIAVEQSQGWGGLIDLDAQPQADEARRLLAELMLPDGETEIAWRAGSRRMPRLVRAAPRPEALPTVRGDGCYLLTGGCGFVGLEIATWLVRHGAKHLVLAGRSDPTPEAQLRLAALRDAGAQVRTVRADIAEPVDAARLFEAIATGGHLLRGIVHAAGAGGQRPVADIDAPALTAVLRPKLAGTLLLDRLSAAMNLDFFVCVSSVASVWGGKGLAHYAAANHVLDAWAHDRRARGLPALSVNCGPWSGGGMATDADRRGLGQSGIVSLAPERYLAALSRLLAADFCQAVVAEVDWSVLRPLHEARGRGRLFQRLGIAPAADAREAPRGRAVLREQLRCAAPGQRRALLLEHIRRELAAVLGFAPDRAIDSSEGFFQLGMDSLMAVELRNRLAGALNRPLAAALVFDFPTVEALASALLAQFDEETAAPSSAPEIAASLTAAAASTAPAAPAAPAAAEPIAIVGMACRFPGGADDPEAFWRLQCGGHDAIGRVPADRWDADACYDADARTPGTAYTRHGGFIDGVDLFDAHYFGISPREAAEMDPQHRLMLELSHAALENAGHPFEAGTRTPDRTGVFVGLTHSDYAQMLLGDGRPGRIGAYYVTGNSLNAAAGRVSYALRLKGPSLTVDTACSSSLVAVDLACRSLRERESDTALAGGVNLILAPTGTIAACQARMLSPDGRCKTFDAAADGYGRGEGAGVVVLKRLSDAVAAGDRIWALILGSAVNQDGRSSGFTVPSGPAQQAVIRAALARAGVQPGDIGYVEAHGTGTALGDPIEAGALGAVFADSRRGARALPVASVKANIGHLESAAGIAGLIRAALVVHHGEIPRMPHLATPNPEIDWQGLALHAVGRHMLWPDAEGDSRRIAGVSSFGVSGTNAHAVLAAPPAPEAARGTVERPAHLLAVSAKTPEALRQLATGLARHLDANPGLVLGDVCHTIHARARHAHRAAWRVASVAQARDRLRACADSADGEPLTRAPRVCFVFGDAQAGAAGAATRRELYATQPVCRAALDRLASVAATLSPGPLADMLLGEGDASHADAAWAKAIAFSLQYALAELWSAWGVVPDRVLGQGCGAWAAACVAGTLDATHALRLCVENAADATAAEPGARAPAIECVCTASGDLDPAQSVAALAAARRAGVDIFLEIGAQRSPLFGAGRDRGGDAALWLQASEPGRSAWEGLVDALAALHVAGVDLDLRGFDRGYARRTVSLPTYPFQRRRYWIDDRPGEPPRPVRAPPPADGHPLLGRRVRSAVARDEIEYVATILPERVPFLGEHRVFGALLLPSSAYLEMVLSAAAQVVGNGAANVLDYRIDHAATLDPQHGREMHLVLRARPGLQPDAGHAFEIVGTDALPEVEARSWTRHAGGVVQACAAPAPALEPLQAVQARLRRPVEVAGFYELLRRHGIEIGPRFHALRQLWADGGEALGEVFLPEEARTPDGLRVDPIVLDACFQLVGAALDSLPGPVRPHLQVGIDRLTLLAAFGHHVWAHARLRLPTLSAPEGPVADLWLYSPAGEPVAVIDGLQLRPADVCDEAGAAAADRADRLIYQVQWPQQPLSVHGALPARERLEALLCERRDEWHARPALVDYRAASVAIESQCAALAAQALRELGWPGERESITLDAAMERLGVTARYRPLLRRLLDMQGGPAPGEEFERLRHEHPEAAAEIALLERTSRHLPGVLRGELDPNEVLFPGGDLRLLTQLYETSPVAAMMNSLVERAVTEVAAGWPEGRALRILEIGAGTGATTAGVLPQLPADRTEYLYTDVADRFTQAAAQRFAAFPFVRFNLLNIDDDPAGQGFASDHFDVVIAANVLHATPRLERSLRHLRQLLAPGGLLVLLEGTAPLRLLDLTFGLTEGWWRFAGDPTRPAYPLIPVAQWQALLEAHGFEGFCQVSSDRPHASALPSQAVMTARAASRPRAPAAPGHWLVYADGGGVGEQLATRLRSHGETATLVVRSGLAPATPDDCRSDVQRALARGVPLRGVVHLASLDARFDEASDGAQLQDAVAPGCRSALYLAQALIDARLGRGTPLYLVTRGAVDVGGSDPSVVSPDGLAQAPVWGLGKVLASEHAELRCHLIDLDPSGRSDDAGLFDELWSAKPSDETRIALRGGRRHAARLLPGRPAGSQVAVRGDRSYFIAGGLGGIGAHIARWLAAQGARHLVLVGRSGSSSEGAADTIRALQARGVAVVAEQADLSQSGQLAAVLARVAAELPPLAGIVHAAGVFADRLIVEQQWPLFEQVFAAKVQGAWNLHRLTRELALDFFVLCSSASTLLGGAGLSNYAAANEFLDSLAAYRRRLGMPGLSIDWGPWAGVGMARHVGSSREAEWNAVGIQPLAPADALGGLASVLGNEAAQVGVMQVDWTRFVAHPLGAATGRFVECLAPSQEAEAGAQRAPARQRIDDAPAGERAHRLLEFVRAEVEAVLGWPAGEHVNVRQGFFDLGMDSLQANELRNRLQTGLECTLPSTLTFRFPTITALAKHLSEQMFDTGDDPAGPVRAPTDAAAPAAPASAMVAPASLDAALREELARLEQLLGS